MWFSIRKNNRKKCERRTKVPVPGTRYRYYLWCMLHSCCSFSSSEKRSPMKVILINSWFPSRKRLKRYSNWSSWWCWLKLLHTLAVLYRMRSTWCRLHQAMNHCENDQTRCARQILEGFRNFTVTYRGDGVLFTKAFFVQWRPTSHSPMCCARGDCLLHTIQTLMMTTALKWHWKTSFYRLFTDSVPLSWLWPNFSYMSLLIKFRS